MNAPHLQDVGVKRRTLRQRIESAIVWSPRWQLGVRTAEPAILSHTVKVRLYDEDDLDDAFGEPKDRWVAANGCQIRTTVDRDSLEFIRQYLFVEVAVEEDW